MSWKCDGLYFSTQGMDDEAGIDNILIDISVTGLGKCFSEINGRRGGDGRLGLPRMINS
jgi:hypothetical protein